MQNDALQSNCSQKYLGGKVNRQGVYSQCPSGGGRVVILDDFCYFLGYPNLSPETGKSPPQTPKA